MSDTDGSSITPEQVTLALDTAYGALEQAMLQVALARSLASGYAQIAVMPDGACKHLRTVETFDGKVCTDCGAELAPAHGVPTGN